jgi:carboxylesterase type B
MKNPAIVAGKEIAVVTTAYGKVRGYMHTGMYTFKGIPYGTARRFMPPEKTASWEGIRSSMTYGPTCPSPESDVFRDEYEFPLNRSHGYYINENCLNLNIWSKKVNGTERKPVMVYLHGGGFSSGSSVEFPSLDGENLSRNQPELYNFGLEWGPVHDGDLLPYQPVEPAAAKLSDHIPLLVGSCKNEYMPFTPGLNDLSMEAVNAGLQKKYGDKTAVYLSAVEKAYPQTIEPADYIDIDFLFRPLVIKQANQKSKTGYAPVYVYLFAWQSPVLDGTYKAFHTMDLPFVFNNIARCEEMTGGGQKACQMADKMSEAWIQFARTGNPNCKKIPDWPKYTIINGATMILDNTCEVKYHHDKELVSIAMGQ